MRYKLQSDEAQRNEYYKIVDTELNRVIVGGLIDHPKYALQPIVDELNRLWQMVTDERTITS